MLSDTKKEYFKKLLTKRMNELLTEGNKTVNSLNGLGERFPDPSDRATVESETDFTLRVRERGIALIGQIREALEKIENGTYGICEECEEEISEGRLEARPGTTLCIECKREQESQEKLRGL